MNAVYYEQIQTNLSAMEIFKRFRADRYCAFLDSGMDHEKLGRYSFISSNPFLEMETRGSETLVRSMHQETIYYETPFTVLKSLLQQYKFENKTGFPFAGGALGFFAYDLCHFIEKLPRRAVDDLNLPGLVIGFYDGVVIYDHARGRVYLAAAGFPAGTEQAAGEKIAELRRRIQAEAPCLQELDKPYAGNNPELFSHFTREEYCRAVKRIREYIRQGDIYQVNMTQRFTTPINRHPLHIYERLREINPAPFAAYLDYGIMQIVSSSPERFLQIQEGLVETRPIKGTMPRGKNGCEDEENKQKLFESIKDRAENLMIVDLLRNDLGKVCRLGSVRVPELFAVETYPTVFHLVSTVTGKLAAGKDAVDCLVAAFPGGSITGAPKIRAMEIIDELEPVCRHVYTGSIGYIGFDGNMDLNIVIRTILIKGDRAFFQVGGGIVWDSVPEKEYQETLDKGLALKKALLPDSPA